MFVDSLDYISLFYSSSETKVERATKLDDATCVSVNNNTPTCYPLNVNSLNKLKQSNLSLEYVHKPLNYLFVGIAINKVEFNFNSESLSIYSYDNTSYTTNTESVSNYSFGSIRFLSLHDRIRLDLIYLPKVIEKTNYSLETNGIKGTFELEVGHAEKYGIKITLFTKNNEFSIGYNKENENNAFNMANFTYNAGSDKILIGYNTRINELYLLDGTLSYKKSKEWKDLIGPKDTWIFDGIISFYERFNIKYQYVNNKYFDATTLDKNRLDEEHINTVSLGLSFDI